MYVSMYACRLVHQLTQSDLNQSFNRATFVGLSVVSSQINIMIPNLHAMVSNVMCLRLVKSCRQAGREGSWFILCNLDDGDMVWWVLLVRY